MTPTVVAPGPDTSRRLTPDGRRASRSALYVPGQGRDAGRAQDRLRQAGLTVAVAADLASAHRLIVQERFDLYVLDVTADQALLTAIRMVRAEHPALVIVGIIDPAHVLLAGEALHAGFTAVLPWTFDELDLLELLADLDEAAPGGPDEAPARWSGLVAQSAAMRQVVDELRAARETRSGVLVFGPAGTGRHLIARAVAHRPGGRPRPFVVLAPADGTPQVLERDWFGPSPERRTESKGTSLESIGSASAIWRAQGGTLLVDGLENVPARLQARLARLLRDREVLVDGRVQELDLQPVAIAEASADALVDEGRLRRDVAERFGPVQIEVPALRRRREDVPVLATRWLADASRERPDGPMRFSRSALALLAALPWPGHARELRRVIATVERVADRAVIQVEDLVAHTTLDGFVPRLGQGVTLRAARGQFERECISAVLARHHGRVGDAARALGIQRTNLYRKVRQLKIPRSALGSSR
jgi:DNA-binding NtrC family response regulator